MVDIIGIDQKLQEVIRAAKQFADSDEPIVISGETGTGKELIAELIAQHSGARNSPFVPVNCGGIIESLQESEIFGHVKGAFTGAVERKIGKLERAHGGTLFLDEIGEMSLSLQAALLRTIQSGEYSPVGSSETRYCKVRVIAAANCDLAALVKAGKFRADLFYRLNILRLDLPPLRERRGDIAALANHFARTLGALQGKRGVRISPATMRILLAHDYPGNVRELENFMRRAVVLCDLVIEPAHLPAEVAGADRCAEVREELGEFQTSKAEAVEKFEREYLTSALVKTGGIVSRAASYSGLSERNFHEKLKRYRISAKSFRAPVRA
jgi:DNA-binding NtrC family response regulator